MTLRRTLLSLFRRADLEAEMEEEMRAHIDLETAELVGQGLPQAEARRQAALSFGGVQQQKEAALEDGVFGWVIGLRRSVRIAARTLWRNPTFSITATLALALAIAVNTTMFSVLDAMMNPRGDANDVEELFRIRYWGPPGTLADYSWPARTLGDSGRTYIGVTGARRLMVGGTVERGDVIRQSTTLEVRANYFTLLRIPAIDGVVTPSADPAEASTAAVISEVVRAELFAEDESPLGKSVYIAGRPFRVIGVVARVPGSGEEVWVFNDAGGMVGASTIRLRPGMTGADAQRELDVLAARGALSAGADSKEARFEVAPWRRQFEIKRFHWALLGAGLAVLLVACTNLANLQLARGIGRAGEIALRSAVGASRPQVVGQLVVESAVLAAAALLLALVLALMGNAIIHATIPPHIGEYVVAPRASWRMLLFAAVVAAGSLVLVGLVPAVHVSRIDLNTLLKNRAGTGAHRKNRRIYGTLVIVQIALTLPLVSAAVLLSRSAVHMGEPEYQKSNTYGFDTRPLVLATFVFPDSPDSSRSLSELAATLVGRARAIAGVEDAAVRFRRGIPGYFVAVDDTDGAIRQAQAAQVGYDIVTPSYFRTMGLPIERGRDFSEGAHLEGGVILDRGSGWFLWPRSSPIGRVIKLGDAASSEPWLQVQGIVGDSLSEDAREIQRATDTLRINRVIRVITTRDSIAPSAGMHFATLVVRAPRDPQRVASAVRRAFVDDGVRPPNVQLFDEAYGITRRAAVLRFVAGLFTTFGVMALGLSALGVYGIVAQSVADRKREVAVRISLGATPGNIVFALIRDGNVLVLAGVAIGLYSTKETIGWLGNFLGEVDLTNAAIFGALCIGLFCAMALSALVPAVRATRMNPMDVLRSE